MRRTLSQMQAICQQYEQSGLSGESIIAYQTFNYWYNRITSTEDSGFTEVPLLASRKASVVIFPSGARITFGGEPSARLLKELVS